MRMRFAVTAVAIMGIVLSVPALWAQDLGEVARRDRERRSRMAIHGPVLTNEDLARPQILTPELKARILSQGRSFPVPDEPPTMTAFSVPRAPWAYEIVPPAVTIATVQELRRANYQRPEVEVLPPAAIDAQTLRAITVAYSEPVVSVAEPAGEPISLGEYARQLRAHKAENIVVRAPELPAIVQAPEVSVADTNVPASHDDGISLGEYARQLQARRVAEPLMARGPVAEVTLADAGQPVSLGEYARQLQLRHVAEPLVAREPEASETLVDAGQPVSLGEYARQLRTIRALPEVESATLTPLPPRIEEQPRQPEVSLGEYARLLRIRRAADEYARLLAQDEFPVVTRLTALAKPPLRYHQIRLNSPAQPPRQLAPTPDSPVLQGHIAVTVRRGDSLWRLARMYMGAGARWHAISFLHGHPGSPQLIREGEVVLIPVSDEQRARAYAMARRHSANRVR